MATKPKIIKWGPRTVATAALWEAADRRWLLKNHPRNCLVCRAALDDDRVILHRQFVIDLAQAEKEAAARRAQAAARYYEGGFKITTGGVPARVAAHVKNWKPKNRAALYAGT